MAKKVAMQKLVFFDLETGGTDPAVHPIIQIGALAVNGELEEAEEFEVKIRVREEDCSREALEMNHYDVERWREQAVPEGEACRRFSEFLKRHATLEKIGRHGKPYFVAQLIGHNAAAFDGPFLRAWYQRLNEFLPASHQVLCTLQRAQWYFLENPNVPAPRDYKLGTLCGYFGVELSEAEAHDAMADVRATFALYQALSGVPVLNRTNTTGKVRFFQNVESPWNVFASHNGDRPPAGQYRQVSSDAVVAVLRLLDRAGELEPRGLSLKVLLEKAESFRAARVYTGAA